MNIQKILKIMIHNQASLGYKQHRWWEGMDRRKSFEVEYGHIPAPKVWQIEEHLGTWPPNADVRALTSAMGRIGEEDSGLHGHNSHPAGAGATE